VDDVEEGRQPVDLVEPTGQRGGQVEAEPVDVHLGHPVPEAVHDHPQDLRVAGVERVPRAGVVHVDPAVVLDQAVVGRVVDPPEAQRGAHVVALGSVVVDDVEDHFDAGAVEVADHRLELPHLFAPGSRRRVGGVRSEVAQRVVAPVVAEALPHQVVLGHEVVDGQELDGGYPEALEVLDHRRAGQTGVGAPELGGNLWMAGGQALDVGLVDDRVVPRRAGALVVPPREQGVGHHRLGNVRGRIPPVERGVVATDFVAEHRIVPVEVAVDGVGVGVDKKLVGVEPEAVVGLVTAVHPVAVPLAGADAGQVAVPHEGGDLGQGVARLVAAVVEQTQLHPMGRLGEEGEIGTFSIPGGTRGVR
jgi:hypothetical protein